MGLAILESVPILLLKVFANATENFWKCIYLKGMCEWEGTCLKDGESCTDKMFPYSADLFLDGFSSWLILLTIQLNRRPYIALAMASLTFTASSTELCLIMVSPRATIPSVVRASCRSLPSMPSKSETVKQTPFDGKSTKPPIFYETRRSVSVYLQGYC